MNLASYLDSTNLRPEAAQKDIELLCKEAAHYKMAAVCIHPCRLPFAAYLLKGSPVHLCTVIGFPLGANLPDVKRYEAQRALEAGAHEIDMVVNLGAVKDRSYALVKQEVQDVLDLKKDYAFIFKLIVETALLSREELMYLTQMLGDTEADYIKTSTGFSTRGAMMEDIQTIMSCKPDKLKIKASGGIRSLDAALQFIAAGVDRIGTSSAVKILEDYKVRGEL